tara:strand:- start:1286 stop:1498 length:213 start_codon:yes stop_codon:yes gene_type:complete
MSGLKFAWMVRWRLVAGGLIALPLARNHGGSGSGCFIPSHKGHHRERTILTPQIQTDLRRFLLRFLGACT